MSTLAEHQATLEHVVANVALGIRGKDDKIRQAIACWLAGGHILLEDVPGTGKTVLARALSKSVHVPTTRVQFTPDLLPADIIGTAIFDKNEQSFRFTKGPPFYDGSASRRDQSRDTANASCPVTSYGGRDSLGRG